MNLIAIALMLLPLMDAPSLVPQEIQFASSRNGDFVAAAVAEAAAYVPAWEQAMRAELVDSPEYAGRLAGYIREASQESGVSPSVIWAVMYTESHGRHWGRPGVVKRGGAGEVGAMQVQPWWERSLERKYGVKLDLFNMRDNIMAGALILSRGGSDLNVMLSYYNTGQHLRSTPYQRKVMRYLSGFEVNHPNLVALREVNKG